MTDVWRIHPDCLCGNCCAERLRQGGPEFMKSETARIRASAEENLRGRMVTPEQDATIFLLRLRDMTPENRQRFLQLLTERVPELRHASRDWDVPLSFELQHIMNGRCIGSSSNITTYGKLYDMNHPDRVAKRPGTPDDPTKLGS